MPLSYWLKPWFQSPAPHEPGVTVPACSPSHWEAEAQAGDSEVQGQVEYLRLSQEKVTKSGADQKAPQPLPGRSYFLVHEMG